MKTGSVCTGYAGLDRAVHEVMGGELAWVADNDPGASAILAHRFPSVPNLGDISTADWSAVEPADVLTAGFPCQDVSCAGGRAGLREGNRTGVWAHVARAIDALRPPLVVLENVRGLLSAGADSDVESCAWCLGESGMEHALRACGAVLGDLADLGYDARWTVVSAADAGAPHRRERIFIVAWPAVNAESIGRGLDRGRGRQGGQGEQCGLGVAERGARVAADPGGGELPRRGVARVLGSAEAGEPGEGDQRERPGNSAGDGGPAPEDADRAASGERRESAPGQAAGGRSRADAGGSGGTPAADTRSEGLEVGTVEHHGPERQAAERGGGDAAADPEMRGRNDRVQHAVKPGPDRGGIAVDGDAGGGDSPAADAAGDGRDEGRPEPAGLIRGPDAAIGSDELRCPSCGCTDDFHDHGGFCAGPCGGNCVDPELGRPDGGWNSFEDDADPAAVRAYALAHSKGVGHGDTGTPGERGIPAAAVSGAPADADRGRLAELKERGGGTLAGLSAPRRDDTLGRVLDWGQYEPAIRRWERVVGRPAPAPTEPGRTGQRLSPKFVEWMQGLPEGWVTDVPGLSRNAQLKALGNGVVPAQAAMALRILLARMPAAEEVTHARTA